MASKDKDYRLITLVTDICPIPLRRYFLDLAKSDTGPGVGFTTLDQYMVFRHSDVKALMNFPKKSIRKDQYDLIYPNADETKWDVTLLTTLLRGLFVKKVTRKIEKQINVIREKRNKLQHKPGSVITNDAEFDSYWKDIETATQTLALIVGGTTFEKEVIDQIQAVKVNNLPRLGDTLRSWYEDIIIELKNEIKELKEETVKVKKTSKSSLQILQGVSQKRPISKGRPARKYLKIVDVHLNRLRDYFRQTIDRELPTDFKCQPEEEREIMRHLQEHHCVVVTGSENTSYLATTLSAINGSEKYSLDRCFEMKTVEDWNRIDPYETDLVLFTEPFIEQQNESRLQHVFQSMLDTSKESRIDVVIVSEISRVNHWKENHDDNEIFNNVVKVFMPTDENNPLNLEKRNKGDKRHSVGGFLGNMIAQSEVLIQDCKTDTSDNNELMKQAREMFKKHKAIVITGFQSGTSTRFALNLVSSLYSKDECVILTEASDYKQVTLGKVSVIVIDEFAGKYKYNPTFVEAWLNKFDLINSVVKKRQLNVIITCESSFFEKVVENYSSHALLNHRIKLPVKAFVNVVVKEEPVPPTPENPSYSNTDDSAQESEQAQSTNEAVKPECGSFVEIVNYSKLIKEFCEVSDGTTVCTYQTFESDTVKSKWFLAIFSLETLNTVESKELAFEPHCLSSVQGTNEIISIDKMELRMKLQSAAVDNSSIKLAEIDKTSLYSGSVNEVAKIVHSDRYITCDETHIRIYRLNWAEVCTIDMFEGKPLFYDNHYNSTSSSSRKKKITDLTVGLNEFYVSSLDRIIIFDLKGVLLKKILAGSMRTCIFNDQMLIAFKRRINILNHTDGTYVCSLNGPCSVMNRVYYGKENKRLFVANFLSWSTCVVKTE